MRLDQTPWLQMENEKYELARVENVEIRGEDGPSGLYEDENVKQENQHRYSGKK
jgi:hypothetical protein